MAHQTGRVVVRVEGRVRVPGDKSISHRALMLAALGDGTSRIRGILDSADVRSTAGVLRALGARVPELSGEMEVPGVGLHGLRKADVALDCGNSGTTTRLMAGVVAAFPWASTFVGDESLSRRPMRRIARPLETMGARFTFERGDGLPMTIHGSALRDVTWHSETASAQVKSAILLAALAAGVAATVNEPQRSRDHTERMLAARGAELVVDGASVRLTPTHQLRALDTDVPGDPSSAAFLAAVAALATSGALELPDVCVNPTRAAFFDVLREMGADVRLNDRRDTGGEPIATLHVRPGALRGVTVSAERVPAMIDEVPLLACVAVYADGETVVTGARELRVKESDRLAVVAANLRAIGAEVEELPDGLRVPGRPDTRLRGSVATHGDHRIAMAFGVLGAIPGNEITVDDPHCVDVSYPDFWRDLHRTVRT
jgi:3-phosphoshikimate 1-carboxyvinyltransferase